MLSSAATLSRSLGVGVAVSIAPNLDPDTVRRWIPDDAPIRPVQGDTYDLMRHADAGIVTSGTATLEMGWFGTPMVVVYRTSLPTYVIGRALVKVPAIGLVNIVAGRNIVPEYIQYAMTPAALAGETRRLLTDQSVAAAMRRDLSVIRERLGPPGASERVARAILQTGGFA
jgi:lipid-A-disaccharide synthase